MKDVNMNGHLKENEEHEKKKDLELLLEVEVDYYTELKIERTATTTEITKSYRTLALKYHPDRNPNVSRDSFQRIQKAYEVLSDSEKRRRYDLYGVSLRPQLSYAKIQQVTPLLFSCAVGTIWSGMYTLQWQYWPFTQYSYSYTIGMEIMTIVLGNQWAKRHRTWNQVVMNLSMSDRVTIACMGLIIGNVSGWLGISCLKSIQNMVWA